MDVNVSHQKNPAMGWDVSIVAKACAPEGISRVEVLVNGSSRSSENFNPPASHWQKVLTQQGQYPGDNKVEACVTDSKGNQTTAYDEWS
jgi:hypothetical protein